jgi:uncharacterized protein
MNWPQPVGRVNDFAHVLSQKELLQVKTFLDEFYSKRGIDIVVVILPHLIANNTIEEDAVILFEKWGIGDRERDDGILLLLSLKERRVRIETGYGAEALISDAVAGRIIREVIVPELKKEDFGKAIYKGAHAIVELLGDKELQVDSKNLRSQGLEEPLLDEVSEKQILAWLLFVIFMFLWFPLTKKWFKKYQGWNAPPIYVFFFCILDLLIPIIILNVALSLLAFLLTDFRYWQRQFQQNQRSAHRGRGFKYGKSGLSGWGGSDGSSSSGGFRGGRSGGGGASGSW